jgi:DNA-directed RNA polymerase subunit RPC12/RpoP
LPRIDTSGAAEARRRLEKLVAHMQPSGVCDPQNVAARSVESLESPRAAAEQGAQWVMDLASKLAVEEARKTTDEAAKLVRDKGLGAIGEVDDFLKRQGARVRADALRTAEAEVKKGADRAAAAVHKKLSTVRSGQVSQQAGDAGRCAACGEPIVAGDRVTICPTCGRRYHAGCYAMTGCVSASCRESSPPSKLVSAASPPPAARPADGGPAPISLVKESFPQPRRCTTCGARVSRGALVCPQCGRWLYSGRMSNNPKARQHNGAGPGCGSAVFVLAAALSALALWWFVVA